MSSTENGRPIAEELRASIEQTLAPIRQHVATIDAEIERVEGELAGLRELRKTAGKMLAAMEAEPAKARKEKDATVSPDLRDAIERAIRELAPKFPDGFTNADLEAASAFSGASVRAATKELREMGRIRLDRYADLPAGQRGRGPNVYKLTAGEPEPAAS